MPAQEPIDTLIVKLAARCNMACTYCYWFRDLEVFERPALMPKDVVAAFLMRLRSHLQRHDLAKMTVVLHGGEPLLFGKGRFARLCRDIRAIEAATATSISICVTTNGVLVDDEWAAVFRALGVNVTVSIDGPAEVHDRHRPDLAGRPTHQRVLDGIATLRAFGVEPGFLTVCDPSSSPETLVEHLVNDLDVLSFDVLIPDATHEDAHASIAPYYARLFDLWMDEYASRGVRIRFLEGTIRALAGYWSGIESIGFGPVGSATLCTDGAVEVQDVCRIAGSGSTTSAVNVLTHEIAAIQDDPLWREIWHASLNLAPVCQQCPWQMPCGGGHIASRWSTSRRFDNPSAYCDDLQAFLGHAWARIGPTLDYVVVDPEPSAGAL